MAKSDDPTSALLASGGLERDPDVRAAVKSLALATIQAAKEILEEAMPQTKLQLIRVVLPLAAKALNAEGDDEEMKDMKRELSDLYSAVRGAIGVPEEEPDG